MKQNRVNEMIKKIKNENGYLYDFGEDLHKTHFEMQFTNLNILFENFAIQPGHSDKMRIAN